DAGHLLAVIAPLLFGLGPRFKQDRLGLDLGLLAHHVCLTAGLVDHTLGCVLEIALRRNDLLAAAPIRPPHAPDRHRPTEQERAEDDESRDHLGAPPWTRTPGGLRPYLPGLGHDRRHAHVPLRTRDVRDDLEVECEPDAERPGMVPEETIV